MKQIIVLLVSLFLMFATSCMDNPVDASKQTDPANHGVSLGVFLSPAVMAYYNGGFDKPTTGLDFAPYRTGAETFLRFSTPEGVNVFGKDFYLGNWPTLEYSGDVQVPVTQGLGDLITNLVVDGLAGPIPMGLVINGSDSLMLTFADYYPSNVPNGTGGWRIRLEKHNDDQLVLFQGFSGGPNTQKVWQAVVFVTDSTSYINDYPDIVAFLPHVTEAFPPAFSTNESDVAISGGTSYLNQVEMFTGHTNSLFDGKLVGYYSFYAFEENGDFSDFIRVFMSEEPTEPVVGMWYGEVVNGELIGEPHELDKVFVRHEGQINQENVLAYGRYGNRGISLVDFLGLTPGGGGNTGCTSEKIWFGDESVKNTRSSKTIGEFDLANADSVHALLEYSPLNEPDQQHEDCEFSLSQGSDTLWTGIILDQGEGDHRTLLFTDVPANFDDAKLIMWYRGPAGNDPNSTHIRKLWRCR